MTGAHAEERLLDALPDPVIGIDADRRIVAWNRAAETAYGFTRAEAIGQLAPELLRTRFPAPLPEILDALTNTGGWRGALVHVDRSGREIAVDSRWSAWPAVGGSGTGALWVERAQHRAGEPVTGPAASSRRHDAQHRLDALCTLASTVAHDLNNLLAVIVNYSALIGGELEAAHRSTGQERWALVRNDVGEIRLAAERAAHLSRRLLAATRGEDGPVGMIGSRAEPCELGPRGA